MGLAIFFFVFFFCFLDVFLAFDQKWQKPRENQKNKKNKIADPNSPACTYMGLAILFFFWFLTKSSKNLEKTKNKKQQIH